MLFPRILSFLRYHGWVIVWLIASWSYLLGVDARPLQTEDGDPPESFVIGGEDVAFGAYPWVGALITNTPSNDAQFCGCSAIDPYWILTAAHCVDDATKPDEFRVLFGSGYLGNRPENQFFQADAIILHPSYSSAYDLGYDIALVKLKTPLPESIPVLPLISDPDLERDGATVKILGWGLTNTDFRNFEDTDFMKEVDVPLISRDIANGPSFFQGYVTESMLAAGRFNPYATGHFGDSGGPLLGFNHQLDRWEQLGVTSFGAACDKDDNPITVYTRVSTMKPWIDGIIGENFFHWMTQNGLDSFGDEDGDNHASLAEYLLGLDPEEADAVSWLPRFETDVASGRKAIVLPIRLREEAPKLGFHLEKSLDLRAWASLEFPWDQFARERFPESGEILYEIPLVSRFESEGFYRLRREDFSGILYGPYPLQVGSSAFGQFNQGIEPGGVTRYDYLIDTLGLLDDIRLTVVSDVASPIRLRVVDVETGIVKLVAEGDARPHHLSAEGSFITGTFTPVPGQQYLARVESTQQNREQEFAIKAAWGREGAVLYPGLTQYGELTTTDNPYRRTHHFADTYRIEELRDNANYLFTVRTEAFDPVIFVQDVNTLETVQDVHERIPIPEESVRIRTGIDPKIEVTVTSRNANELGSYSIEVQNYSEPISIRPGQFITKFFNSADHRQIDSGTTFYVDSINLNLSGDETPVRVTVLGYGSFRPYFQIVNITDSSLLTNRWAWCEDITFNFTPEAGKFYGLLVYTTEDNLGENYWVELNQVTESSAAPSILSANPQRDWQ